MQRFNWSQVREYWESHSAQWAQTDDAGDPDALRNVCLPTAPHWLNQYLAATQYRVHDLLLRRLRLPPAARVLDVGCGSARWSSRLQQRGYRVVGVDLQESLLERNRRRYPGIEFVRSAIQDFRSDEPFDLINHVTVIQHIPHEEQRKAVQLFRTLLRPGGHVLAMEDVVSNGLHVFAHAIPGWIALFEEAGFRHVCTRRYDYGLLQHPLMMAGITLSGRLRPQPQAAAAPDPATWGHFAEPQVVRSRSLSRRVLRGGYDAVMRSAVTADRGLEPLLVALRAPLPCRHCGFLFRSD